VCGDFGKKERCDHFWMLCVEHDECIGSCEIGESRVVFFFFFFLGVFLSLFVVFFFFFFFFFFSSILICIG